MSRRARQRAEAVAAKHMFLLGGPELEGQDDVDDEDPDAGELYEPAYLGEDHEEEWTRS